MDEGCNIRKSAIELNKNLQKRPTLLQLANNGIYPPLNGPVRYSGERKKLIIAQTKDFLQHKFERRPPRKELEKQSILIASQRFDPLVSQRVPQLKRSFLETNLNVKLMERPGPLELVAGNILKPDDDMLLHLNSDELCTEPNQECEDKQVKVQCSKVLSTKPGKKGMKFYYYDGVLVDKKNPSRSRHESKTSYIGALEQQMIYLNERHSLRTTKDSGVGLCDLSDSDLTERIPYYMDNFTVSELKEELKSRGCLVSGKKLDLARRLARYFNVSYMDYSPAIVTDQSTDEMSCTEVWPQLDNSSIGDGAVLNSPVPTYADDFQWDF